MLACIVASYRRRRPIFLDPGPHRKFRNTFNEPIRFSVSSVRLGSNMLDVKAEKKKLFLCYLAQTQRASPREKGERRPSSGTRAGVGDSPGNTRALFRSTRGKELGLWPGTRVFVGIPGLVTDPV
jgi:hypothetical protein